MSRGGAALRALAAFAVLADLPTRLQPLLDVRLPPADRAWRDLDMGREISRAFAAPERCDGHAEPLGEWLGAVNLIECGR